MKSESGKVFVLLGFALILTACSSTPSDPDGCLAASACTGDPGAGCAWACIDAACEKLCTEECATAIDCGSQTWPLDCTGHWECRDHVCEAICDGQGCTSAEDCEGLPWEDPCPGHWECQSGDCIPVCDSPECSLDSDCVGQLPCPAGGNWNCLEAACVPTCDQECQSNSDCNDQQLPCEYGGHWLCLDNNCQADCDPAPDCQRSLDCLDLFWPDGCFGRWECQQGTCEAVCDNISCPNGLCDEEMGETADSCPMDCDYFCELASDCEDLFFPFDCEGYWECQENWCVPFCGGGECDADVDCIDHPWLVDCQGEWDCLQGLCVERCEYVNCGDGLCDHEAGESFESCFIDCDPGCIPEGLPSYGAQAQCCPGLVPVEDCLPGEACPGAIHFCVDCENGQCDPHEHQYNCPDDCPDGCPEGEHVMFPCENGDSVPWCTCKADSCVPICVNDAGANQGWVDGCTGQLIMQTNCQECFVACDQVGDLGAEGYYAHCPDAGQEPYLILSGVCAPRWECVSNPLEDCP